MPNPKEILARKNNAASSVFSESKGSSKWNLQDLKSGKQLNDLEKKIGTYQNKNNAKIFNFTSVQGQEGVSTIVVNLARQAVTKGDKPILMVDANFHNPSLDKALNVAPEIGLCDVLAGEIPPVDAIHAISPELSLLPTGHPKNRHGQKLDQQKLAKMLSALTPNYAFIFIDSPPLLTDADSLTAATVSDITFIVIKSMVIRKEAAEKAKVLLEDNGCMIGGVILNFVRQVIPEWLYRLL